MKHHVWIGKVFVLITGVKLETQLFKWSPQGKEDLCRTICCT